MTREQQLTKSAIRKLDKGWTLEQNYSYGIPYWRWVKGKKSSNYPRVNEDGFCHLLSNDIIGSVAKSWYVKK